MDLVGVIPFLIPYRSFRAPRAWQSQAVHETVFEDLYLPKEIYAEAGPKVGIGQQVR